MSRSHIITGLDVGSSKIRIAVGQYEPEVDDLKIIGVTEYPSNGIINGNIISVEDIVSSVSSH